jgi:hypothetical protein
VQEVPEARAADHRGARAQVKKKTEPVRRCQYVLVDGDIIRVQCGGRRYLTVAEQNALAEVVRAAKRRLAK